MCNVTPVLRHHRGGAETYFADIAVDHTALLVIDQEQFDARVRAPDTDDRVLVRIIERSTEPDAGLRAGVAGGELCAEAPARLLRESRRHRASAHDDVLHARQVVGVEGRVAQHQRDLRGDTGEGCHALAREELERGVRAPARHDEAHAASPEIAR